MRVREEAESASEETLRPLISVAEAKLANAGAHYVVESVADVPPLLDLIEARIARGERP